MSQAASSETINFARKMIGAGFRSVVVRNSTGVSRKIIENMRKNSDAPESSCGPLSSAETLIKSNAAAVEATIFLLSYRQLAIKPDEEIDVEAVIAAFDVYQDAHGAARGGKVDETVLLDINDAWVIARDYRSAELSEHYCGHCGISFFRPVRLSQKSCPLCQLQDVEDQPSAFDNCLNISKVRDEALKMRNWGQSDDEIARSLGVSSDDVEKLLSH